MKKIILFIVIFSIGSLFAESRNYKFEIDNKKEVELSFQNIVIDDMEFYSGDKIIIEAQKNVEALFDKGILQIEAGEKTDIEIMFPEKIEYAFGLSDLKCVFTKNSFKLWKDKELLLEKNPEFLLLVDDDKKNTRIKVSKNEIEIIEDGKESLITKDKIVTSEGEKIEEVNFGLLGKMLSGMASPFLSKIFDEITVEVLVMDIYEDGNTYEYLNVNIDLDEEEKK